METTRLIIFIIACGCILFGYFRLLSDEQGHVDLNNYRFTGGLGKVLYGVFEGLRDLLAAEVSSESVSACAIYAGIILFILGFSL
ncbi:MetJ regulator of methionine regulon [Pseudoalteromonas shioyasakiensis]|uniref:MetJ regulator of methionine regulon n=1 Tax=Pseudoalteromonas shioyasakiensis TaxID=1190813 RepID=UPI002117B788|nr:MetJ regulator of methionine regulon [Pseudoalteromonas shioyasakiensis]MCQ8876883.1 MetJ regulator of methionine regulon [Pseudoalteromonas shioyasakiensis]